MPEIIVRSVDEAACARLSAAGCDARLARLFAARGLASIEELSTTLHALAPPERLSHVREAAILLADAIARREKLLVVADYDADGATACAVAVKALRAMGALVDYLVALGTVADVVKLDANNRILVSQGLARIRAGKASPGIAALFEMAGRSTRAATAYDLAYCVGPRLNAAGRLDDMALGIECLLAADRARAMELAIRLDRLNRERREIEAQMQESALALVGGIRPGGDYTLCVHHPEWHGGVVGILASRLKDRFHRPVFAFA